MIMVVMLVECFGVLECMVYCDICDLLVLGVLIEGEVGIGYCMCVGFDFVLFMFIVDEVEVLVVGVCMIKVWSGGIMVDLVEVVLEKLMGVLFVECCFEVEIICIFVFGYGMGDEVK